MQIARFFAGLPVVLLMLQCTSRDADVAGLDAGTDAVVDGGTCDPANCGPALGMPAYQCPDGSWGGNTGKCIRRVDGSCGRELRECPAAMKCGAFSGGECDGAHFCRHDVGKCSAPGDEGVCTVFAEVCTEEYAPVCGCNASTYPNACSAQAAGESVLHQGECVPTGKPCGGSSNEKCSDGAFCKLVTGACASMSPMVPTGACTLRPSACDAIHAPVCGCDGVTYASECLAAMSSQSVVHEGACSASDTCGTIAGLVCEHGAYCDFPEGAWCGAADAGGLCKPRPQGCTKELAPVCGCDGQTYSNACMAHAAGTDDAREGTCK